MATFFFVVLFLVAVFLVAVFLAPVFLAPVFLVAVFLVAVLAVTRGPEVFASDRLVLFRVLLLLFDARFAGWTSLFRGLKRTNIS